MDKEYLSKLAIQVKTIIGELTRKRKLGLVYSVRIYDTRSVGVQGDANSYNYVAEVSFNPERFRESELYDLLGEISDSVTNRIKDVNRVVYVVGVTSHP